MTPTLIITSDGKTYTGPTPEAAVGRMRDGGIFSAGKSNDEYMNAVAARCWFLDDAVIRTTSAEEFLLDMAAHGYLTIGGQQ